MSYKYPASYKVCEECGNETYCTHCGTCNNCVEMAFDRMMSDIDKLTSQDKKLIDAVEDLVNTFNCQADLEGEKLSIEYAKSLLSSIKGVK